MTRPSAPQRFASTEADALQARFALRVAARLSEGTAGLSPDITERLRFAREQALERARAQAKAVATRPAAGASSVGTSLVMGGGPFGSWWLRLASVLPLVVLIVGLVVMQHIADHEDAASLAQLDAELLADDLPPDAYADPGFTEFLRSPPSGDIL